MCSCRYFPVVILLLFCAAGAVAQDDPVCTVSTDTLNFGTCWVDEACDRSFVITNTGGGVLEGTLHDSGPKFFFRDFWDGYSFSLSAGEQLTVWVSAEIHYYATHQGIVGTIVIAAAAGAEVQCHALYQWPAETGEVVCYTGQSMNVGAVVIGETSGPLEYGVTAQGGGSMLVTVPARLGDFHFEWPGEYLQTSWVDRWVEFRPETAGRHSVIFTPSLECDERYRFIVLSGTGLYPYPAVELNRDEMEFGMVLLGDVGYETVRITNTGNSAVSGVMSVTGDSYHVPEDRLYWQIPTNNSILVTVYFTPTETGERFGTLDLGNELCDIIPLHATGTEASQQSDVIGIYFEQSGQINTYQTTEPWEEVTAYLMVVNPSWIENIRGWECCIEMTGAAVGLNYDLSGDVMNFDTDPCFAVGVTGYPLMGGNPTTLATLTFLQPSPDDATYFYAHPISDPSVPGRPCYVAGAEPGTLVPLDWKNQNEALPIAIVNEDMANIQAPQSRPISELSNHPNPFNPGTTISFVLGNEAAVGLQVYDVSGRIVRTLLDGRVMQAGPQDVPWNGRDDSMKAVAAGVYFYRVEAGPFSQTKRMTLLK